MIFTPTKIPEIIQIEPRRYRDSRGFFMETFQAQKFTEGGITASFIQDNHSGSFQGVLRGLHYQIRYPQGKLVRVIAGEIFDVAVDLRSHSPTFGEWTGQALSAENPLVLWIPPGFAHGFYVLSQWAELEYKTTELYAPEWERTLLWNDPDLAISWPIPEGQLPILSVRDSLGQPFSQAELYD